MITNDNIENSVQDAMDRRAERMEIAADRVLRELALIGFANMGIAGATPNSSRANPPSRSLSLRPWRL
jgi:hypothetical protein